MVKPIHDNILLEAVKREEKTESGIVLPETTRLDRQDSGVVKAVGPGRYAKGELIPMSVKAGDKILFKKYSPEEFEIDGVDHLLISESDVIAIVE